MMKRNPKLKRIALAALALCMAAMIPALANAASDFPRCVPAEHNVVMAVNAEALFSSELYRELKSAVGGPNVDHKLSQLEAFTGFDLERDMSFFAVSGVMGRDKEGCVYIRGVFDKERVLNAVRMNASYEKFTYDGFTCHKWFDEDESRMKSGVFLQSDFLVIADEGLIKKVIDAEADRSRSFESSAAGSEYDQLARSGATAWGILFRNKELPADVRQNPVLNKLDSASFSVDAASRVTMKTEVRADSSRDAGELFEVAEGFLALGKMLDNRPRLQKLAEKARLELDGSSVSITVSESAGELNPLIIEAIRAKRAKKTALK